MERLLIIGGTGSLGRKLIERFLPKTEVAVFSRDENKQWTMRNETVNDARRTSLRFYVGDVRDQHRVRDVLRQYEPTTVIIAAALKHVDTCELSPNESVLTNLVGTQNVISAVNDMARPPASVLFVSTDKACSPVNVYGMCKALSERVVTCQAKDAKANRSTAYLAVRYGNVLESRGSIVPLFKYQCERGEHLTVTDPNMTRFLMTLDDSVDLIARALRDGDSGSTWVPVLPSMRIGDLAEVFSERYGKPIRIVGLRPGEKKHEDLINESESVRTTLLQKHYVIDPAYVAGNGKRFTYSSADSVMTKDQLRAHLTTLGIIDRPLSEFKGLSIEEIAK